MVDACAVPSAKGIREELQTERRGGEEKEAAGKFKVPKAVCGLKRVEAFRTVRGRKKVEWHWRFS